MRILGRRRKRECSSVGEGEGLRKLFEDERKIRGRKEERWFNRTGGSNGDVKAGTKRPVSM